MDKVVKKLQQHEASPPDAALVKRFAKADPPSLLENVNLHEYQLYGMRWLLTKYAQQLNPILGDEMGLGKTLQVIAFVAALIENASTSAASASAPVSSSSTATASPTGISVTAPLFLIVAPLSVLPNWMEQFERFAPSIRVLMYAGVKCEREAVENKIAQAVSNTAALVVVTSYEMVLFNAEFFGKQRWQLLVLDEGHRLKNPKGKLYDVLATRVVVERKVLLSGTPVQNDLVELYSLLSLLNPRVFTSQELFAVTFRDYFSAKAQQLDAQSQQHKSPHLLAAEDLMRELLTPLLLLRTVRDVHASFTLPPLSEIVVHTPLSPMQREYYKEIVAKNSDAINSIAKHHSARVNLTNILPQLRKVCNHPYLFPGTEPEPFCEGRHLFENSGKLYVLQQLLPRLKAAGHCVLLFSQSTGFLDILQDFLTMERCSYERIDGSVRGKERWQAIERFRRDPDTFVFLISTRSGGVGLNLQRADTVIFADSDYNPQTDLQAVARAYRLGQTKPIHVIKFLSANTVEEIIYRRALRKMRMADRIRDCARQLGDDSADGDVDGDDDDSDASLVEMIQFGLHKLLDSGDGDADDALTKPLDDAYIEHILARRTVVSSTTTTNDGADATVDATATAGGATVVLTDGSIRNERITDAGGDLREENMYYFEGEDYAATATDAAAKDSAALQRLLAQSKSAKRRRAARPHARYAGEELDASDSDGADGDGSSAALDPAALAKHAAEQQRKREERRAKALEKKKALWRANKYESAAIAVHDNADDDRDDDADSDQRFGAAPPAIRYKSGDASRPPLDAIASDAVIVVHCVDTSGVWSARGFFRALSSLSPAIQRQYEAAALNDDLKLGQAHLIALPASHDPDGRRVAMYVCLLVVQGFVGTSSARDKRKRAKVLAAGGAIAAAGPLVRTGKSTMFRLHALESALHALAQRARQLRASVHMPRIGYGTPGFNWYAVERIVQRRVRDAGVPVSIYYFSRTSSSAAAAAAP